METDVEGLEHIEQPCPSASAEDSASVKASMDKMPCHLKASHSSDSLHIR